MTPLSLARALTLAPLLAACLVTSTAWAQNCGVRDAKLRGQYDGECRRGWANGQGKASGVDRYEGSFLDGQAHGQGRYTFANQQVCELFGQPLADIIGRDDSHFF